MHDESQGFLYLFILFILVYEKTVSLLPIGAFQGEKGY